MSPKFWIKRSAIALSVSFFVIGGAQYLKTRDSAYSMGQAAIWAVLSTAVYLVVLWRKLRAHPACAVETPKVGESALAASDAGGDYAARLNAVKGLYPFGRWGKSLLPQYTPKACESFTAVFDDLIRKLIALGISATVEDKLTAIREAVFALNAINDEDESLIETGEREDLCALFNLVATAAGLDPSKYGGGEGPASEWREW